MNEPPVDVGDADSGRAANVVRPSGVADGEADGHRGANVVRPPAVADADAGGRRGANVVRPLAVADADPGDRGAADRASAEAPSRGAIRRAGGGRECVRRGRALAAWLAAAAAVASIAACNADAAGDKEKEKAAAAKPALSVVVTRPERTTLPLAAYANGNIAAWQEAIIGTEANGLRIADVRVNVGDVVKRGQTLAAFAPDTVQVDLAQSRAAVVEAEATLAEAAANAERAKTLRSTGALSEATINQYVTAERTARARLDAQKAAAQARQLRVSQTAVLAPDNGVISSRSATVGAVLPAGQELFRMIRQGRLEWRAEVQAIDLAAIKPGMKATLTAAGGKPVAGTVRMVAPTVDPQTRLGIVYVDLPAGSEVRAGMFARGEFDTGSSSALTLPQSAVQLREGFAYVWVVGADAKVRQAKVGVGRRAGERIEVTSGLDAQARVVAAGGGFLGEGDTVRIVDAAASAPPAPTSPK